MPSRNTSQARQPRLIVSVGPNLVSGKLPLSIIQESNVSVIRINASHTPLEAAGRLIEMLRSAGQSPLICMDLPGPKLRIAEVYEGERRVLPQESVSFCDLKHYKALSPEDRRLAIPITLSDGIERLMSAEHISMKDGLNRFDDLACSPDRPGELTATSRSTVMVRAGKSVNAPGFDYAQLPFMSDADREIVKFADRHSVDILCLSFVSSPADIKTFRKFLSDQSLPWSGTLWAKIETRPACTHFEDILNACDGVMLARGDLVPEVGLGKVPETQCDLLHRFASGDHGSKDFILATHVLDSMTHSPRSSVSNLLDIYISTMMGATGLMLVSEVTIGKFPEEAIRTASAFLKSIANTDCPAFRRQGSE